MKIVSLLLLTTLLLVGLFTSEVEGEGLFTGGMDTTYRLIRRKSGGSVMEELSRTDSYRGSIAGFIYDRRLLTFDLGTNFSRESSDSDSSSQKSEGNSRSLSMSSSLQILPASRFPLSLHFGRGQGSSDSDRSSSTAVSTDSRNRTQDYGFTLGMQENSWLPQGSLNFDRYTDWQQDTKSRESLRDSLRLDLRKAKEWRGNSLSMDYNFYRTNDRTADEGSQSHSISLRDLIRLRDSTMLSLESFFNRSESEDTQVNSYGGNLLFNHAFDPTFSTNAGMYFYHYQRQEGGDSTWSANASANKRKELSSKLFLSGSVSGYLSHSDQNSRTGEYMSLYLSSRNIPYVQSQLSYSLNLGQAQGEKASLSNAFSLNFSTYAWQRLSLDGGLSLSLSSGDQKTTRLAYDFGLRALLWRGLSWTSRVSWNNYETYRSLKGEEPLRLMGESGEVKKGERKIFPSGVNESLLPIDPHHDETRSFQWINNVQFRPAYWIDTSFFYELSRSEEENNERDPRRNTFRGSLRLWPPFLPRLQFSLDFYQDESLETGQTQSGWRGTAEFLRGRTSFMLDFNFDNRDSPNQKDTSEGIFFSIRRPLERRLWR